MSERSHPPATAHRAIGGSLFVELVRLTVVVLATGAAVQAGEPAVDALDLGADAAVSPETALLALTVLGAGIGYVGGGILGRFINGRVTAAEHRIAQISSGALVAGAMGGIAGLFVAAGVLWPVLLFPGRLITVPVAVLATLVLVISGARVGIGRGGDLLRFVGASGRLTVSAPSRGATAKLVDTSALIDGRLLDLCRAGFCEGTLVLPQFVLYELQGLADAGDEERRQRGARGLDVLAGLQRSSGVALEVTDLDYPEIAAVDAKLIAMARELGAALLTVDANLARIAEVQGLRVLNLNALAETLRPPVVPGDVLAVRVAKPGKEAGQGVGYLSDGTMVVIEGARDQQGREVACEVTSLLSNQHGRMVFATLSGTEPLRSRAAV